MMFKNTALPKKLFTYFAVFICLFLFNSPSFAAGDKCVSGDCVNGQGTMTYPNGDKYVGEFKSGQPNGQGTITKANDGKYEGQVKDGRPEGHGTMTYANGDKYVGDWKNDRFDGQGTLTKSGEEQAGKWEKGTFIGE